MDKTILMDADVDEGAEVGDVGNDARQLHSRHEVFGRMHPRVELKGLSFAPRVSSRLLQLLHDVGEGRESYCLRHIALKVYLLPLLRLFDKVGNGAAAVISHLLHDGIALGVYGTGVEGVLGSWDTQEAGTLLEGGRAEARHFFQLGAGGEGTVLLAVVHDVLRQDRSQARDVGQQILRGGVDIHADGVDAELHGLVEAVLKFCLVDIMLVLPYPYALRVYLHEFSQRIHEFSADAHGTTHGDILVGELLAYLSSHATNRYYIPYWGNQL